MNKSQFMQSFGKVSEAFSKIDEYSIAPLIANAVDVANIKLEQKIDEWSFAIIMSAIAEAKIAQMPERVDAYHESVMWMTIAAAIKTDKGIRLPQVQADIATALSNVNFVETK